MNIIQGSHISVGNQSKHNTKTTIVLISDKTMQAVLPTIGIFLMIISVKKIYLINVVITATPKNCIIVAILSPLLPSENMLEISFASSPNKKVKKFSHAIENPNMENVIVT